MATANKSRSKRAAAIIETVEPEQVVIVSPEPEQSAIEPEQSAEDRAPVVWQGFTLEWYDTVPPRNVVKRGRYLFEDMTPGQYFFEPAKNAKDNAAKRMSTAASVASRKYGKKFAVRTESRPVQQPDGSQVVMIGAGVYCYDPATQVDA